MNLRFSHFDNKISKDEIKDILEREFRRYAPFEVIAVILLPQRRKKSFTDLLTRSSEHIADLRNDNLPF